MHRYFKWNWKKILFATGKYYTLLKNRMKQGTIKEQDKGDRYCRFTSHLKLEDGSWPEGSKPEVISRWKMPGRTKY